MLWRVSILLLLVQLIYFATTDTPPDAAGHTDAPSEAAGRMDAGFSVNTGLRSRKNKNPCGEGQVRDKKGECKTILF